MPNWKKVIVSGSDAILQDVTINDWGSVSASLASIESTSTSQTLQDVTDNGSTTTNSITTTNSVFASTFTGSLLRLDENGTGMRITNVGGFEPQSGTFNIFGNNDITFGAGGSGASHRVLTMYESDKSAHFANNVVVTGSITVDDTDARLVLDRNAVSNDAEVVFTTNGTENWSIGTGQVGGDNDFTFRSYGSSNAIRFDQDGHINAQGSITGSSFLSEGDILPDQDNVHSLGSSTRRFQLNGGTPVTVTGSGTNGTVTRFSGSTEVENSTITNTDSLTVITHNNDGNDIFIVSGSNGELIKVTDSVGSTLFQVNDGSGISQFEVSSTGVVSIGAYTTIESNRLTISDGSSATATRLAVATYCGVIVDYTIYSTDSGRTNQRTGTYRATFNDSEVHDSETMTNDIGDTNGFVFSTSLDGTNFTLTANNDIGQQCRVSYTVKPILV